MTQEWKHFIETGSVAAYLSYKAADQKEALCYGRSGRTEVSDRVKSCGRNRGEADHGKIDGDRYDHGSVAYWRI